MNMNDNKIQYVEYNIGRKANIERFKEESLKFCIENDIAILDLSIALGDIDFSELPNMSTMSNKVQFIEF